MFHSESEYGWKWICLVAVEPSVGAASGLQEWFQCSEMFPGESGSRSRVSP